MLSAEESNERLISLLGRQKVLDLSKLYSALKTRSRMSVFRRLSAMGYCSSYSHAGRYYTLRAIPEFDADGLWHYQGVGFSRYGSLKSTVEHMVVVSDAGRTPYELHVRLQVRVYNTLVDLVRGQRIGRARFEGQCLYVHPDPGVASAQIARRGREQAVLATAPLPAAMIVEVLLELLQGTTVHADAHHISARLARRGISLTPEQVESVFTQYGVKKTAHSRSRRSQS